MLLIKNLTKSKINEKFLRQVEKITIENIPALKGKADLEIDLAIIGEKRMRSLNRIWRGKDKATDVLSYESGKSLRFHSGQVKVESGKLKIQNQKDKFIAPPDNILHLGEIIICASVARRQAREDGHSFDREMAVLLIHGILHLAGYDHEKSSREAAKMFGLQGKIERQIKK